MDSIKKWYASLGGCIIGSILVVILYSCANQKPLTGGPRDTEAPQIDTILSFNNYQTNFVKQDIDLFFDEYVTLRNPRKQIIITPSLTYLPQFDNHLKRVSIEFNEAEELKDNVTYVVNFGQAIVDNTEGNILENFTLVFSTGQYIDSLSIRGKVVDAYRKEPMDNYLVMLYEDLQDSVVYHQKPFYLSRTDESGIFTINNLRQDTFKLVVLNDKNVDYLFNPETEEIGFLDTAFILNATDSFFFDLVSFKQESPVKLVDYNLLYPGCVQLQLDQPLDDLSKITCIDTTINYYVVDHAQANRVLLFYDKISASRVKVVLADDTTSLRLASQRTAVIDTLLPISLKIDEGIHPEDNIWLKTPKPIADINTDKIIVVDTLQSDTLMVNIQKDSLDPRLIAIQSPGGWPEATSLQLIVEGGALQDFWGYRQDSTSLYATIAARVDYGDIKLQFTGIDTATQYVVMLLSGDEVIQRNTVDHTQSDINWSQMAEGNYQFHIFNDLNGDGEWTTGDYLAHRQPEAIWLNQAIGELRGNSTLTKEIDIKSLLLPTSDATQHTQSQENIRQ